MGQTLKGYQIHPHLWLSYYNRRQQCLLVSWLHHMSIWCHAANGWTLSEWERERHFPNLLEGIRQDSRLFENCKKWHIGQMKSLSSELFLVKLPTVQVMARWRRWNVDGLYVAMLQESEKTSVPSDVKKVWLWRTIDLVESSDEI